jgi:hypothetical protein
MTLRRALALATALVIAGCQAALAPSNPATPPGASEAVRSAEPGPTARPGPTLTPTAIPELLGLTFDDSGPIIRPEDGPEGARYALPAAGARDRDGTYHLLIIWFGDEESDDPPVVTSATSTNTRTWKVGKTPIAVAPGLLTTRPGPIPAALLQLDDGSWQLFGWAAETTNEYAYGTWRSSAAKPGGPWTLDQDVVLDPGRPGAWDSQTAAIGSVQRTANGFAAWYEGQPPGRTARGDLGYATSTDGLIWRKFNDTSTSSAAVFESDPAIPRGICGAGTAQAVYQPQVELAQRGGYLAAFGGFAPAGEQMDVFGGVSEDGAHWTCGTPEPLLTFAGVPNSQGIHSLASFPLGDGRMALLVESLHDRHSEIWLATVRLLD